MSIHYQGAIVQDAQSSCKRQDAAFAATRPAYKQYILSFQSDLVLPISVQILHISHSLPVSTPRISTNHNLIFIIRIFFSIALTFSCHFITFKIFIISCNLINKLSAWNYFHNTVSCCLYKLMVM